MRQRILAISSGGGHWVQMLRMVPAFTGHEVCYATVRAGYRADVGSARFYTVPDVTRWDRWRWVLLVAKVLWILVRLRPHVILSTGAAPGYVAIRLGRLLGARTVWVDSIANVECLSLAGEKAGRFADLWLTQWPHLARPDGPEYHGGVL